MAKTILFLIHGMGEHGPGWETDVKAKLDEVAARYTGLQGLSLWDEVELIPLRYDNHITDALQRWQATSGAVSDFAEANKLDHAGSLDWLDGVAAEDPGFFWSHVADVVVYRFLKLYRERIRASVVEQIVTPLMAIPAAQRDFTRVVFLAHSLGTAVLHDSLHLLGTGRFATWASAFAAPQARFRAIFTLANVSRVLQDDIKAYESVVQPGPQNKLGSNCGLFYNFCHELDPICSVWRFTPEHFARSHYHHRNLTHYREWNLHGFTHYLDNPRVHVHLINQVLSRPAISRSQYVAAISHEAYPQFAGAFADVPAVQAKLAELRTIVGGLREDSDLADLLRAVSRTGKVLREIRDIVA